jgi:hypothetical protein
MVLSRLRLFRIPITLVLLGLLGLSILFIKNSIESAWQSDQQEEALYLKSPNCFTHKDATEVEPNYRRPRAVGCHRSCFFCLPAPALEAAE